MAFLSSGTLRCHHNVIDETMQVYMNIWRCHDRKVCGEMILHLNYCFRLLYWKKHVSIPIEHIHTNIHTYIHIHTSIYTLSHTYTYTHMHIIHIHSHSRTSHTYSHSHPYTQALYLRYALPHISSSGH